MKKFISLFIAVLVAISIAIPAFAADSMVEYNNAREFVFNPEGGDLFQNFKGVMPGDKKEQRIVVKNTKADYPITLYLRAEVADEYREFLDNIDIVVSYAEAENGTKRQLQSSRASESGNLGIDTKLGTFQPDESGYITVSIYVHPEMNNDFKNCVGKIKWVFVCEEGEKITEPDTTVGPGGMIPGYNPSPQTGVTFIAGGIAICVIVAAVVVLIVLNRKKKDEDNSTTKERENDET